jgi:hypothetical protein
LVPRALHHLESFCSTVESLFLYSSPGLLIGGRGRGREGLVSTACACAVIIQILNNLNMYRYFLVYLLFDLNSPV